VCRCKYKTLHNAPAEYGDRLGKVARELKVVAKKCWLLLSV